MYQLSLIADQLAQLLHKNRETVQYNVEQVDPPSKVVAIAHILWCWVPRTAEGLRRGGNLPLQQKFATCWNEFP